MKLTQKRCKIRWRFWICWSAVKEFCFSLHRNVPKCEWPKIGLGTGCRLLQVWDAEMFWEDLSQRRSVFRAKNQGKGWSHRPQIFLFKSYYVILSSSGMILVHKQDKTRYNSEGSSTWIMHHYVTPSVPRLLRRCHPLVPWHSIGQHASC